MDHAWVQARNGEQLMIALTVLVTVTDTMTATLYPTERTAQTQPAWQIKIH